MPGDGSQTRVGVPCFRSGRCNAGRVRAAALADVADRNPGRAGPGMGPILLPGPKKPVAEKRLVKVSALERLEDAAQLQAPGPIGKQFTFCA